MRKFLLKTTLSIFTIVLVSFQQLSAQTITSFLPASGPVGTLVTINGTNLSSPTAITIGGINAIPISNTGTKLVAMVMPGAVSGKVSVGTANATGNFSITASVPPTKQQGNKLVGSSTGEDLFGWSTAISADGNTAVVGATFDNGDLGAAFVFVRNNGTWTQQGKLVGFDKIFTSQEGSSVAISADGNTVIVGGNSDNYGIGAAWVFTRSNGIWSQQGNKLVGTGSIGSNVAEGNAVSLSADGNTAIIGGLDDNTETGAVWVFTRSNGVWTQQGEKLTGAGAVGLAIQGISVALSADGNTFIEGGPGDSLSTGAAWVFVRKGNTWVQQGGKLVGAGFTADTSFPVWVRQGTCVSISANGNIAAIGGQSDKINQGAIWFFIRNGDGTWTQRGDKVVGVDTATAADQGTCISMSADGRTVVEGGWGDNNWQGAVWKFVQGDDGYWRQSGNKLTGSGGVTFGHITPQFGISTAISADCSTIIAGGDADNNLIGAAWVFADSSATALPVTLTNFAAYPQGKGVQTTWSGYSEINMASYDVERSANGYQFNNIGNVTAKDDNASENNYTWFDASPLVGDNYYRIEAISTDGTVQYSRIAKVTIGNTLSNIQVYPNPASNKTIQVQLNNVDDGTYAVAVYNAAGQKVYSGNYVHAGGYATLPVAINGIAPGIYHVEVKGINKTLSTKVVVQ